MPDQEIAIMPALNESPHVARLIAELREVLPATDVVVIDDGSTDGTAETARGAGARVLRHPIRLGYGAALQTGYLYALRRGADRCLQLDADGQHDPRLAPSLLALVREGRADLVVASRYIHGGAGDSVPPLRRIGSALLRRLARALAGLDCSDPTSGYRAMNRRALQLLSGEDFPDDYPDVDVLIALAYAGVRLAEVPAPARQGWSGKSMHGGLRPLYYSYKMLLASLMTWRRHGFRGHALR